MLNPVQTAAVQNDVAALDRLMANNADPDTGDWPPLCLATMEDALEAITRLIFWGADVDRTTPAGLSAAEIAAMQGNLAVLALLVASGARLSGNELVMASREPGRLFMLHFLLRNGPTDQAPTALLRASYLGHAEVVGKLLEWGVKPCGQALVAAATAGKYDVCRQLLNVGAPHLRVAELMARDGGHHRLAALLRRKGRLCAQCGRNRHEAMGRLKKCGACKQVYYCSETCQKIDWATHRVRCKAHI